MERQQLGLVDRLWLAMKHNKHTAAPTPEAVSSLRSCSRASLQPGGSCVKLHKVAGCTGSTYLVDSRCEHKCCTAA